MPSRNRPIRPEQHIIGDQAVLALRNTLPRGWVCRELPSDYGIDCEIEVVDGNSVTGALVKAQVKGTMGAVAVTRTGVTVSIENVRYWLALPVPTILVRAVGDPPEVRWLDVREYLRQQDRLDSIYRTHQKTVHFNFRHARRLPADVGALRALALDHQVRVADLRTTVEGDAGAQFIGYVLLVDLYEGDPDKMIQWLREKGSLTQLVEDLPFVVWVKEQAERDPDFLRRVRRMVEEATTRNAI